MTETTPIFRVFASLAVEIAVAESDEFETFLMQSGMRQFVGDFGDGDVDASTGLMVGRYDVPAHLTTLLTGNPEWLEITLVSHPTGTQVLKIRFANEPVEVHS